MCCCSFNRNDNENEMWVEKKNKPNEKQNWARLFTALCHVVFCSHTRTHFRGTLIITFNYYLQLFYYFVHKKCTYILISRRCMEALGVHCSFDLFYVRNVVRERGDETLADAGRIPYEREWASNQKKKMKGNGKWHSSAFSTFQVVQLLPCSDFFVVVIIDYYVWFVRVIILDNVFAWNVRNDHNGTATVQKIAGIQINGCSSADTVLFLLQNDFNTFSSCSLFAHWTLD